MQRVFHKLAAALIAPLVLLTGLTLGQGTASAAGGCNVGSSTIAQCFPDPVLAKAVADKNGVQVGSTFTQGIIDATTSLSLDPMAQDFKAVKNINGIEKLSKINDLYIRSTKLTSIAPLAHFASFSYLTIKDSPNVKDFSPLQHLVPRDYSNLVLRNDGIADLSQLPVFNGAEYWNEVDLSYNEISDVSLLHNEHVGYLDLSWNKIIDLSPIGQPQTITDLEAADQHVDASSVFAQTGSMPTAKNIDGSFIAPIKIRPSSGSYDSTTGLVTWGDLKNVDKISFVFETMDLPGCDSGCSFFGGTVTADLRGAIETESLEPTPNSIPRRPSPPSHITPTRPPSVPRPVFPAPQIDRDPGIDPAPNPLSEPTPTVPISYTRRQVRVVRSGGMLSETGAAVATVLVAAAVLVVIGLCLATVKLRHDHL